MVPRIHVPRVGCPAVTCDGGDIVGTCDAVTRKMISQSEPRALARWANDQLLPAPFLGPHLNFRADQVRGTGFFCLPWRQSVLSMIEPGVRAIVSAA